MSFPTAFRNLIDTIHANTKAALDTLRGNVGDLGQLSTTDKTSLVAAVSENQAAIAAAAQSGGAAIDDAAAGTATVYSSSKTESAIAAAKTEVKNEILDGAAAEVDTLRKIAESLSQNETSDAALAAAVANKANTADVYTKSEIGDPTTDLAAYWATKGAL